MKSKYLVKTIALRFNFENIFTVETHFSSRLCNRTQTKVRERNDEPRGENSSEIQHTYFPFLIGFLIASHELTMHATYFCLSVCQPGQSTS